MAAQLRPVKIEADVEVVRAHIRCFQGTPARAVIADAVLVVVLTGSDGVGAATLCTRLSSSGVRASRGILALTLVLNS